MDSSGHFPIVIFRLSKLVEKCHEAGAVWQRLLHINAISIGNAHVNVWTLSVRRRFSKQQSLEFGIHRRKILLENGKNRLLSHFQL